MRIVSPYFRYVALEQDVESRQTVYQELFRHPLVLAALCTMQRRMNRSGILSSDRVQEAIASVLGRRVPPAKPGRPRQTPDASHTEQIILL
jgi:hypothetical protein